VSRSGLAKVVGAARRRLVRVSSDPSRPLPKLTAMGHELDPMKDWGSENAALPYFKMAKQAAQHPLIEPNWLF
jgi:hypothetical protein